MLVTCRVKYLNRILCLSESRLFDFFFKVFWGGFCFVFTVEKESNAKGKNASVSFHFQLYDSEAQSQPTPNRF